MKIFDHTKKVVEAPKPVVDKLAKGRDSAFNRFPLIFTMLATFGVVTTFYGFEGLISKVDWLADNPVAILLTGIGILLLTGSLYKKL